MNGFELRSILPVPSARCTMDKILRSQIRGGKSAAALHHCTAPSVLNSISHIYSESREWTVDCVKPTKHCWEPTVINSPHLQEFMVSRILCVVLIFLRPLSDEFTVMEVF